TPSRFGSVESDLYRGSYPKPRNFPFLGLLRLRTILSLTPQPPNMDLITFCRENSITSTHVRVDKPKEGVPMSFSRVAHILQILVDINNHPLYVHCNDGTIVTGVVILCLRKLQLWTSASSVSEYRRYMREESIGESEMVFLEKFQGEIELPMILPDWLW
ncbi:protein-tyrosine phosphatase, partial [Cladochytrium replicatum]